MQREVNNNNGSWSFRFVFHSRAMERD